MLKGYRGRRGCACRKDRIDRAGAPTFPDKDSFSCITSIKESILSNLIGLLAAISDPILPLPRRDGIETKSDRASYYFELDMEMDKCKCARVTNETNRAKIDAKLNLVRNSNFASKRSNQRYVAYDLLGCIYVIFL